MKRIAAAFAGAFLFGATAFSQVTATLLLPVDADTTANSHYLNFYFGAMMAARDLGNEGIRINLEAIDIRSRDFLSFGNRMKIVHSDILIGPVTSDDIISVLSMIPAGKPLVSPLDAKTESLCDSLPVILASTPSRFQTDDAMNWLLTDMKDTLERKQLVVVSEGDVEETEASSHIHSVLDGCDTSTVQISYKIYEGVEIIDTFNVYCENRNVLSKFFAASDKDVFIKDVLRQAAEQTYKSNRVEYYGNGKVRNADIAELCAASTHMSSTFFVDYSDVDIQRFILEYRAFFGTDPDSFAFHGYDVLHYFVNIRNLYGPDWPRALPLYSEQGLQTDFKFNRGVDEDGGAVNTAVRRIVFSAPFNTTVLY